jgi:hypothetical protein
MPAPVHRNLLFTLPGMLLVVCLALLSCGRPVSRTKPYLGQDQPRQDLETSVKDNLTGAETFYASGVDHIRNGELEASRADFEQALD